MVTNDISNAVGYASIEDVRDSDLAAALRKIVTAKEEDFNELKTDYSIISMLSNAGCKVSPTVSFD